MRVRRFALPAYLPLLLLTLLAYPTNAHESLPTLSPMISKVLPSVVRIETFAKKGTAEMEQRVGPQSELPPDSPLWKLFPQEADLGRKSLGAGSGFVIDETGIIVTNNHVLAKAEEIEIIFSENNKHLPAKILGADGPADLAILQISSEEKIPFVAFGDSDNVNIGDWVIAIGNPFAIGNSVSVGVISAKHREVDTAGVPGFLQTDATLNRGNSGGPLFNQKGEVVGVNTAIFSPTGSSVGIGFAVPSNFASFVINELRTYGRVRRAWFGIKAIQVSREVATSIGAPTAGILITEITQNSPAQEAGLRAKDIIVSWGGNKIQTIKEFENAATFARVGTTVFMQILRDGKNIEFSFTAKEKTT